MKLEKDEIRLSSSSTDAGESEDVIESSYKSDPLIIGFNSQYMLDFLRVTNSGEVRLEFKDSQSAGQMRPEAGTDEYKYRYIIMPMRI
jgi:DNA polymerase-3 subunit beta